MEILSQVSIPVTQPTAVPTAPCQICHDFLPLEGGDLASFFNYYDIDISLLDDNCGRCCLLRAIVQKWLSFVTADYEGFEYRHTMLWLYPQSRDVFMARLVYTQMMKAGAETSDDLFYREIYVRPAYESETDATTAMGVFSKPKGNRKHEQAVRFLKQMLQNCECGEDLHGRCLQPMNPILPSRVVRIGLEDGSLQLHETRPGEIGKYIALSHCWGPPDRRPIRTTNETLADMKSSIPWSSLSAVFRDAIWLCRQLGIQYIWIDSLCITQDSERDWDKESARMAQYYSQAHLTIAVESSPDGTVPFLEETSARWQPWVYSTADKAGRPFPYVVQEHHVAEAQWGGTYTYSEEGRRSLPSRAWAMQETFLSRRAIHFTPSDMIWHCHAERVFHGERRWTQAGVDVPSLNPRPFLYDLARVPLDLEDSQQGAARLWSVLVNHYCRREITFNSDRLPAFSGLASQFEAVFNHRYLAGIWEAHLPYGLLWMRPERKYSELIYRALEEWVAPSWSWASLPGGILVQPAAWDQSYRELDPPFRPKVLESFCDAPEEAPFGRVRSGYILLEAPLFKVQITCTQPSDELPTWPRYRVSFGPEVGDLEDRGPILTADCLLAENNGNASRATDDCQLDYRKDPSTFQATGGVVWLAGNIEKCVTGLVLGLDAVSGGYQRLGYLEVENLECGTFPSDPPRRIIKLI